MAKNAPQLVLSLFPGIGMLDRAFEEEGFCVVRGPDLLWGGDICGWHVPPGRFDGVIGGPPCQHWSPLANICRARGIAVKPDRIPEFERVVSEASPQWFLMENVPRAPKPCVAGYEVHSFLLNNRHCSNHDGTPAEQRRIRRWSFGWQGQRRVLAIELVALQACRETCTVTANGTKWETREGRKGGPKSYRSQADFRRYCVEQGLPEDFDLPPFTVAGKVAAVGNGVPLPMGRAVAKAVKETLELAETVLSE